MKLLSKVLILLFMVVLVAGCSQGGNTHTSDIDTAQSSAQNVYIIPMPTASGVDVEANDRAVLDYSNIHHGYVVAKFIGSSDAALRVVVVAPHGEMYIYSLSDGGLPEVIPLTEGDGDYRIGIYENLQADQYAMVVSINVNVVLEDEFAPFLRPNQFVNFTSESELVALAADLTKDAKTTKDKILAIYNYVVDNFSYDYELAASVKSGYLPDLEEVLHKREGICFDYSALLTAMLRSQGIPAMLDIGYHGEQYHAWISIYCEEEGWIDSRYHHDGEEWSMMDPTVESGERKTHNSRQDARDDNSYRLMYNY